MSYRPSLSTVKLARLSFFFLWDAMRTMVKLTRSQDVREALRATHARPRRHLPFAAIPRAVIGTDGPRRRTSRRTHAGRSPPNMRSTTVPRAHFSSLLCTPGRWTVECCSAEHSGGPLVASVPTPGRTSEGEGCQRLHKLTRRATAPAPRFRMRRRRGPLDTARVDTRPLL